MSGNTQIEQAAIDLITTPGVVYQVRSHGRWLAVAEMLETRHTDFLADSYAVARLIRVMYELGVITDE